MRSVSPRFRPDTRTDERIGARRAPRTSEASEQAACKFVAWPSKESLFRADTPAAPPPAFSSVCSKSVISPIWKGSFFGLPLVFPFLSRGVPRSPWMFLDVPWVYEAEGSEGSGFGAQQSPWRGELCNEGGLRPLCGRWKRMGAGRGHRQATRWGGGWCRQAGLPVRLSQYRRVEGIGQLAAPSSGEAGWRL